MSTQTPIDKYISSWEGGERDGITRDVAFNRKQFGEGQPENPDQGNIYVGLDGIEVDLVQDFDDETLQTVFTYSINATRGIDPRNPPEPVDWEEMMKGGLQTALEDIRIAFAVYGASRTSTHQIVRSRRAAFHQQSQRAHYYGDLPSVRMPESWLNKDFSAKYGITLQMEFESLAAHAAHVYRKATDAGVSYQDARFALLEGTTNFILCEYSLQEFIALYAYRACSMFQWEICHIVREMGRILIERHEWLAPYIKISCEKTHGALDGGLTKHESGITTKTANSEATAHTCTFQGWESVDGQCDFPWARETNRSFRSEHHRIEDKSKS